MSVLGAEVGEAVAETGTDFSRHIITLRSQGREHPCGLGVTEAPLSRVAGGCRRGWGRRRRSRRRSCGCRGGVIAVTVDGDRVSGSARLRGISRAREGAGSRAKLGRIITRHGTEALQQEEEGGGEQKRGT